MALESTILSVSKPTIELDGLPIVDRENPDESALNSIKPSKFIGSYIPYVVINGYEFSMSSLQSFELNTRYFLPSIRITVTDQHTIFQGRHFPKDGDVISFYIRANNEKVFEPIHIDFDIIRIDPSYNQKNSEEPINFTIYGQMKIPGLFLEECLSFTDKNSFDTLLDISQNLKLGFASNETSTSDEMTWVNPFDTNEKFIKDITSNSYKDEESFFHSFIDLYYTLNFLNINSLFSTNTDIFESETYSNLIVDADIAFSESGGKMRSPHLITNHFQYQGTSKYTVGYKMFNSSGTIFIKNGYKRYSQFFETSDDSYISEFVDPFTTEGSDSQIHLKGRYTMDGENAVYENILDKYVKYKFLGKQDSSENGNVHENYMFSNVLNYQNNEEIFKMGMIVDLSIADLTFYKFQRIPVFIFDYDPMLKHLETEKDTQKAPVLNKFLSGYYLIAGIDYMYNYPGPITQRLHLIKREFKLI